MEPSRLPSLLQRGDKALPQPVLPHLVAVCPTIDLVAVVTKESQLDVYRFNGQRAFTCRCDVNDSQIDRICWKYNGRFLAVGYRNGKLDIVSAEKGQVEEDFAVHRDQKSSEEDKPSYSSLSWSANVISGSTQDDSKARSWRRSGPHKASQPESKTTDDWAAEAEDHDAIPDFMTFERSSGLRYSGSLPEVLSTVDIETLLPKLSVLPVIPRPGMQQFPQQASSRAFASRLSIDDIFHDRSNPMDMLLDVLLLCHEDGSIRPILYHSSSLDLIRHPSSWGLETVGPVVHACHPISASHMFLVEFSRANQNGRDRPRYTALLPLTLRFIKSSGRYLRRITSRSAHLHNLLRYTEQCLASIDAAWTLAHDLPSRFMRNVEATLAERNEGELVQSLYHLAVTGHCPPIIKEWLVDELTERGHKRWDQASTQGYTKIVELIHENLLPALDRCTIVISTLKGLADFYDFSSTQNLPQALFSEILDLIQCLRLLGHNMLLYAGEERRQFFAFSKWLRYAIDTQATANSGHDEDPADDPGIDYGLVLQYMQGGLGTGIVSLFNNKPSVRGQSTRDAAPTFENIRRTIDQLSNGGAVDVNGISVWRTFPILRDCCDQLFDKITSWLMTEIRMDCGLILEDEEMSPIKAVTMSDSPSSGQDLFTLDTYVAVVPADARTQIRLHQVTHDEMIHDIKSSLHHSRAVTIQLPEGEVKDMTFVGTSLLLILFRMNGDSYVLSFQYKPGMTPATSINLADYLHPRTQRTGNMKTSSIPHIENRNLPPEVPTTMQLPNGHSGGLRNLLSLLDKKDMEPHILHTFSASDRFTPLKIEVRGGAERELVCVLGEDLKHYKLFELQSAAQCKEKGASETQDVVMEG